MPKRGSVVAVPESWLEQCRQWRKEEGLTVEAAGAHLARAIRRARPFSDATVRRYLRGSLVTDELTRAFAKVLGTSPPVKLDDEDQQTWHDLGARLKAADVEVFSTELLRLKQLVSMAEYARFEWGMCMLCKLLWREV